jgi:ubiquinone/menaquinone biosynthesis C-methylase UbiE
MPDVYASITEADTAMQERLADVLELRAADPQQRAMLESYTAELDLPAAARLLEIGCGTGAISRFLATLPDVDSVLGLDPGELFVERARELTADRRVEFAVGDGRELQFDDGSFDAVVCHTTLCHVPGCERAVAEAHRVLRPGGQLAVFDGDYATGTVALYEHDPLQACVEAALGALVHDPWVMRRIAAIFDAAGFDASPPRAHAYVQTREADYMLTLIDRGADLLAAAGGLDPASAEALKGEARARVADGRFYGLITYVSAIARRR